MNEIAGEEKGKAKARAKKAAAENDRMIVSMKETDARNDVSMKQADARDHASSTRSVPELGPRAIKNVETRVAESKAPSPSPTPTPAPTRSHRPTR